MNRIKSTLSMLWNNEEGQDLTEYALLLVLLTLSAITALDGLAGAISTTITKVATNLQAH